MNLKTLAKRLPMYYIAKKCIYITSPPGIGKTATLVSAPQKIEKHLGLKPGSIGCVVINGPLLTPADSVGYLVPKHFEKHSESIYTDPFWYRTPEGKRLDEYEGGVIIVDEADKMDSDVKKVIGEAALSGRLGPHVLPPGWVIWMAGNRSADRSGSTKELDHLINRRMEIEIQGDLEAFDEWCSDNGVSPLVRAFAHQNPHIVFPDKVPEKQGPWCTPRSLVAADAYLQVLTESGGDFATDPTTVEEVQGMIGQGPAAQLFAFVKLEREMPRFEKIIAAPKTTKVPEKPDAQMLVCYNLAHRVDKTTCGPVVEYVERMPKEMSVIFAKAACRRDHNLVTTPSFINWAKQNAALMAMIAQP